jgi:hypothetical protein
VHLIEAAQGERKRDQSRSRRTIERSERMLASGARLGSNDEAIEIEEAHESGFETRLDRSNVERGDRTDPHSEAMHLSRDCR